MSESKYRIPKLAMAVMVFGGLGCGDDGGGEKTPNGAAPGDKPADGPAGIDISEARYTRVVRAQCKLEYTCPNIDEEDAQLTEQQCVDDFLVDIREAIRKASKECVDAYLDYYECYTGLGCDGEIFGCRTAYQTVESTCGTMLD